MKSVQLVVVLDLAIYSTKAESTNLRVWDLKPWPYFEATLRKEIATLQERYHFEYYDVEVLIQKYSQFWEKVLPMVVDSVVYLNKAHDAGENFIQVFSLISEYTSNWFTKLDVLCDFDET